MTNYRKKRIGPTIALYEQQLAAALDVEPVTKTEQHMLPVEHEDGKVTSQPVDVTTVDDEATRARAAEALAELREAWAPQMASWQDLYDTWPEELRAAKKATAVDRFAAEDAKADTDLDAKVWTMADKRRKIAERDQP